MINLMSSATTDEREQIRLRLIQAGNRRAQGKDEATEAMKQIIADIRRGLSMDPPMTPAELAHLSKVTRETVYQIWRKMKKEGKA